MITRRATLAATATMLAAPYVRAQSARVVRFASVGGFTDAPLYIAQANGYFAAAGLDVRMQRLASAPELLTATVTSQVDASGISITPGLFAAVGRGLKLALVGDKNSIRPGFSATRLILRPAMIKADEAQTVRGLAGRRIALSARPSSVTMLMEDLLHKHGMALSDVQLVELPYPNMMPGLASGAVDGAIDLEPFMTAAIRAGLARDVCDFTEFTPATGGSIVPLVFSETFKADRARAQDFMNCFVRGARVYNDAFAHNKDREHVIAIIAKGADRDPALVRDSFPAGLDPDQHLDRSFVERLQQFFVRQKMLTQPIDVDRIIDPSFAAAAVAALGPYH